MKKFNFILLLMAVCSLLTCVFLARAVWRKNPAVVLSERSLTDQALSMFSEEVKALTSSQISLQQSEINSRLLKIAKSDASTRADIESIPFWQSARRAVFIIMFSLVGAGVLVVSIGGAIGIVRRRSIVPQQLSEGTTINVHYATVRRPEFALFLAKMTEIERVRAEYPEAALKLTQDLMRGNTAQLKALARSKVLALPSGSASEESDPVVHVPTFRDLYLAKEIAPDKAILFGLDSVTGDPVRGSWQDLYSSAIAGQSGNGKSSTARSIILQSLLTDSVEHFYILDPHRHKPEGLVNTLGKIVNLPCITYNQNSFDIPDVLDKFNRRMNARISGKEAIGRPVILVADELLTLTKNIPAVANTIKVLGTEGRGFGCFGLFLAQSWVASDVGGSAVRDNLTSLILHKMKRRQAQTMTQDSEVSRQVSDLMKGEAIFESTNDEPRKLKIPFCSKADVALVYDDLMSYRAVVNGSTTSPIRASVPTSGLTMTPNHPVNLTTIDKPVDNLIAKVSVDEPGEFELTVADVLTAIRERISQGIFQKTIATEAGIDNGLLSRILKGERPLTENIKTRLTIYLNHKKSAMVESKGAKVLQFRRKDEHEEKAKSV